MTEEEAVDPSDPEDGQESFEVRESDPEPQPKKKRKIDLKSRLSSVRGSGSMANLSAGTPAPAGKDPLSFPPPPTTGGGIPAPKLPGISAPAASSSPFAPPEPEVKKSAQQQTIKVEMGEEVVAGRKKARRRTVIIVALAAIVFGGVGAQVGIVYQKGRTGFAAVAGAGGLATDIEEANKVMMSLSDALRDAVEKLGQDEYPGDLSEVLKKTNVPFSAANFKGKGVAGLPSEIFDPLLKYTSQVDDLNQQKDKLRNLLGAAKPAMEKYVKEKKSPVVNFSVVFEKQSGNTVALLVINKKPFAQKEKFPAKYTIVRPDGKKTKDVEMTRYMKGDVIDKENTLTIPVAEKSVAAFTSRKLIFQMKKALADTKVMIDGLESPNPSLQKDGLLKEGERLVEQLKKVKGAGG